MNPWLEIAIIAIVEGILIVWTMERVPRVEAWFASRGRRKELNRSLKRLKAELKAIATIKHIAGCGVGMMASMTHHDRCLIAAYMDSLEHDLQLQINDVRGRRNRGGSD